LISYRKGGSDWKYTKPFMIEVEVPNLRTDLRQKLAFIHLIMPEYLTNENGKMMDELIRGSMVNDISLGYIFVYSISSEGNNKFHIS
jgi:hypothetical protein